MTVQKSVLVWLIVAAVATSVIGLLSVAVWQAWQSSPAFQFREARRRWEMRPFRHYRLAANYEVNWAQCHYDIEVRHERVVQTFGLTCLSSAPSKTLTIDGIFETFERYLAGRVCSPTGCYCEGIYVVRATYDPTWGYPQRITTEFRRNWLDDLLRGKAGIQECVVTTAVVEIFDVVKLSPLP